MEPQQQTSQPAAAPKAPAAAASAEYPVNVTIDYPEKQSRLLAVLSVIVAARIILLIPTLIVVGILGYVALLVALINLFAIMFTGHSSAGMHKFITGVLRWNTRSTAYMYGLTDKYPPFRMDA